VIEQYAARRVQYELRLEMQGQFKSWCFLQSLPTAAGKRALAIEAEEDPMGPDDHFEGAIRTDHDRPVGAVMVWDQGHYLVHGGHAAQAYRLGEIDLTLAGEKCAGRWTLRRLPTRSGARTAWLVIKEADANNPPAVKPALRGRSVLTGRTIDEIVAANSELMPV
jgi:bifunctional non-homologous end joining protein LigD